MRNIVLTVIGFFMSFLLTAQTKGTSAKQMPAYIGTSWKIFSIEEFGVAKSPNNKAINDMLLLNSDNSFLLRVDSADVKGKYSRLGKSLVLRTDSAGTYYLTVLKELPDTLTIQCKSPDLITSIYKYIKQ